MINGQAWQRRKSVREAGTTSDLGLGAIVGQGGGLIGLGGAEFRLLALPGVLHFAPRQAVPVNLVSSFPLRVLGLRELASATAPLLARAGHSLALASDTAPRARRRLMAFSDAGRDGAARLHGATARRTEPDAARP